jgi:hypothetical protein
VLIGWLWWEPQVVVEYRKEDQFKPRELANLVWAFAKTKLGTPALYEAASKIACSDLPSSPDRSEGGLGDGADDDDVLVSGGDDVVVGRAAAGSGDGAGRISRGGSGCAVGKDLHSAIRTQAETKIAEPNTVAAPSSAAPTTAAADPAAAAKTPVRADAVAQLADISPAVKKKLAKRKALQLKSSPALGDCSPRDIATLCWACVFPLLLASRFYSLGVRLHQRVAAPFTACGCAASELCAHVVVVGGVGVGVGVVVGVGVGDSVGIGGDVGV